MINKGKIYKRNKKENKNKNERNKEKKQSI